MLSSGEEQSDPASFSYVTTPEEKFGDHARVHGRTFCILDEGRTGVESFLLSAGLRAEITASDSGSATARLALLPVLLRQTPIHCDLRVCETLCSIALLSSCVAAFRPELQPQFRRRAWISIG